MKNWKQEASERKEAKRALFLAYRGKVRGLVDSAWDRYFGFRFDDVLSSVREANGLLDMVSDTALQSELLFELLLLEAMAVRAIENYTAVGASKAALESLVRHLAVELGPKGINVNTISAGAVDTEALKKFPNREEILDTALSKTPLGRLTTPEDVADIALFLCSDLASMIQGQTIVVDGGYSIHG